MKHSIKAAIDICIIASAVFQAIWTTDESARAVWFLIGFLLLSAWRIESALKDRPK